MKENLSKKEKIINPNLRIDSNELIEKAKISLEKVGVFSIHWLYEGFDEETIHQLFELDVDFIRVLCPACNSYWYAFKRPELEIEKDEKGLCINCGELLALMVILGIDEDIVREWMTSKGEVNPLEIIKMKLKRDE